MHPVNLLKFDRPNPYFIYELVNPITSLPFYVGKSRKYGRNGKSVGRFAKHIREAINFKAGVIHTKTKTVNMHKCNTILQIINSGLEVEHRIVFETFILEEAMEKEIELIAHYGRRCAGGILTNQTTGGEGVQNWTPSDQQRQKMSDRMRGSGSPSYGKPVSAETRKKISVANKALYSSGEKKVHPKLLDPEYIKMLVAASAEACSIPIHQICPSTGQVIATHKSAVAAVSQFGDNLSNGTLKSTATLNRHRTYRGYYWRNEGDPEVVNGMLVNYEELNLKRLKPKGTKRVKQLDLQGNLIKVWNSTTEAMNHYGKNVTNLNWYIKRNRPYVGHLWAFD